MNEKLYRSRDLADLKGVKTRAVSNAVKAGTIHPVTRVGTHYLFDESALEAFLAKKRGRPKNMESEREPQRSAGNESGERATKDDHLRHDAVAPSAAQKSPGRKAKLVSWQDVTTGLNYRLMSDRTIWEQDGATWRRYGQLGEGIDLGAWITLLLRNKNNVVTGMFANELTRSR